MLTTLELCRYVSNLQKKVLLLTGLSIKALGCTLFVGSTFVFRVWASSICKGGGQTVPPPPHDVQKKTSAHLWAKLCRGRDPPLWHPPTTSRFRDFDFMKYLEFWLNLLSQMVSLAKFCDEMNNQAKRSPCVLLVYVSWLPDQQVSVLGSGLI